MAVPRVHDRLALPRTHETSRMPSIRIALPLTGAFSLFSITAHAADAVPVAASDMHIDRLRAGTSTYLVYRHGKPGGGIERPMLATSTIKRERVDGADAWVIEQRWETESGEVHGARTVHSARDLSTLAQTTTWKYPAGTVTTRVTPKDGSGRIEGELAPDARAKTEQGFAAMKDGWWFNWHSDLALLPLLPFEKGGTLRLHLFDVGMPAAMDVDYTVTGSRTLQGGDGTDYDCWLVETESGSPGSGNIQRFWIDKQRRIVVKEEDVFNGMYRSKVRLSVPATIEFPLPPAKAG